MASLAVSIEDQFYASQYFWWLAFLRSSKDYWWICQEKGRCKDPRLVKVWRDFGNIFEEDDLMDWWSRKGPKLFDNPQLDFTYDPINYIGVKVVFTQEFRMAYPGMICLAIPIDINSKELTQAIEKFIADVKKKSGKSPKLAPYKINWMNVTTLRKIVTAYQSMSLKISLEEINRDHPSPWGYYEIGNHLNYSPLKNPDAKLSAERLKKRRNSFCSIFCQRAEMARRLITNVEIGKFPCTAPVEHKPRWDHDQQLELNKAVADRRWQPETWLRSEHAFLFKNNSSKSLSFADDKKSIRDQTLSAVLDYNKLFMPYLMAQRQKDKALKVRGWKS